MVKIKHVSKRTATVAGVAVVLIILLSAGLLHFTAAQAGSAYVKASAKTISNLDSNIPRPHAVDEDITVSTAQLAQYTYYQSQLVAAAKAAPKLANIPFGNQLSSNYKTASSRHKELETYLTAGSTFIHDGITIAKRDTDVGSVYVTLTGSGEASLNAEKLIAKQLRTLQGKDKIVQKYLSDSVTVYTARARDYQAILNDIQKNDLSTYFTATDAYNKAYDKDGKLLTADETAVNHYFDTTNTQLKQQLNQLKQTIK